MADDTQGDEQTPDEPAEQLGDAGKKALDAERKARRDAEQRAKDLEQRLQAIEDKDKSEVERLAEQVTTLTKERDAAIGRAERLEVVVTKALDEDDIARVTTVAKRLTGSTREELEADADELLPLLSPRRGGDDRDPPPGRPHEALRGGGDPTEDPSPNLRAVVDSIPRGL